MATNFIKENNVNYLITTAPPFSTHIIGLKLKEKLKINWISISGIHGQIFLIQTDANDEYC